MIIFLIVIAALTLAVVAAILFLHSPRFGRMPQGKRMERMLQSPNYHDGQFHNIDTTVMMTPQGGRWRTMLRFLGGKPHNVTPPEGAIQVVRRNYRNLPAEDCIVWFGHSSYLLQINGVRYLVDPVFYTAAPFSFVNKPFAGVNIFKPEELPDIDYLVISHDHWDHLDYQTVTALRDRVGHVVCPLGVGEHFERWGYAPDKLIEMDWQEQSVQAADSVTIHCLPARHFSGRGLRRNPTLWASYLLQMPDKKVYIGGDGGYGSHFKQIGERFADIDLAILENGQYNTAWSNIHTLPEQLQQEANELNAKQILTVHHSKYALAMHAWDEPLHNEQQLAAHDSNWQLLAIPVIGEIVPLHL